MSEQPPTTTPLNLSATARNYAREDDARLIGSNVLGLIQIFGQHMDLETLDGVTLAYDYTEALAELDRGVESNAVLTASKDWGIGGSHDTGCPSRGRSKIAYLVQCGDPGRISRRT